MYAHCPICNQPIIQRRRTYCSRRCAGVAGNNKQRGRALHPGRLKGAVDKKGYVRLLVAGRLMMAHRFVMGMSLGRPLHQWEDVHHRNGNKSDNHRDNLEIVLHRKHRHQVECPNCRFQFAVR